MSGAFQYSVWQLLLARRMIIDVDQKPTLSGKRSRIGDRCKPVDGMTFIGISSTTEHRNFETF